MPKSQLPYRRVARTHAVKPEHWPLDKKSIKVTVASPRLVQDARGQNRRGVGRKYP